MDSTEMFKEYLHKNGLGWNLYFTMLK